MRKAVLIIALSLISIIVLQAEEKEVYEVDVADIKLSTLLSDLKDRYDIYISFNDDELSKYSISLTKEFSSIDKLLDRLLKSTKLQFSKEDNSYIIYPLEEKISLPIFKGVVLDIATGRTLIGANVIYEGGSVQTDRFGQFTLNSLEPKVCKVNVSYVGFEQIEFTCIEKSNNIIYLNQLTTNINQVDVVGDNATSSRIEVGEESGKLKLNPEIASILPGAGDNMIFTYLRLMPGVRAAGEANTLSIRGSTKEENLVLFDGFKLYNLWTFKDGISSINPLLVSDIELYKSGGDVSSGDRTGGYLEINGNSSVEDRSRVTTVINSSTLNLLGAVALSDKFSIAAAARTSYFNKVNKEEEEFSSDLSNIILNKADGTISLSTISYGELDPEYGVSDLNVKVAGDLSSNNKLYFSGYLSKDNYSYTQISIEDSLLHNSVFQNGGNRGAAVYFSHQSNSGYKITSQFSYSQTDKTLSQKEVSLTGLYGANTKDFAENSISEYQLKTGISKQIGSDHIVDGGVEINRGDSYLFMSDFTRDNGKLYGVDLAETFSDYSISNSERLRYSLYLKDQYFRDQNLQIEGGLRFIYSDLMNKAYLEPRGSARYRANDKLTFSIMGGIYHQFERLIPVDGRFDEYWIYAEKDNIKALKSIQTSAGVNYKTEKIEFSAEPFFRDASNLYELISFGDNYILSTKQMRNYGMDLFYKRKSKYVDSWVSYTYMRSKEKQFGETRFSDADLDQRHELKLASIFRFKRFTVVCNYVLGSGLYEGDESTAKVEYRSPTVESSGRVAEHIRSYRDSFDLNRAYSRFDLGAVYGFETKRIEGECGVSILNLFNRKNIDIANLSYDDSNIEIRSENLEITPIIFLKLSF